MTEVSDQSQPPARGNVLVLLRHGESEWNKLNLFTGWKDIDLSEKGVAEARNAGRLLKGQGLKFDVAFTSDLKRAQRTLALILEELGQTDLPILKDQKLNERDIEQAKKLGEILVKKL